LNHGGLAQSNLARSDPYVRWCGRGGAARLPPIPILCARWRLAISNRGLRDGGLSAPRQAEPQR
jgi:hypothetical protein